MRTNKRIIIIGAGPAGLGAAYRLRQLGIKNFTLYERNDYAGGLCASFTDNQCFTWDLGGHVVFSDDEYFHEFVSRALGDNLLNHRRRAWIFTKRLWIPYPFQNNIKYLPRDIFLKCLRDLEQCEKKDKNSSNFYEWIINNFGKGIGRYFLLPYNFKVWSYPLGLLSYQWVPQRINKLSLREMKSKRSYYNNQIGLGPNAIFRYPREGGVGKIFRKISEKLNDKIKFRSKVVGIDTKRKIIRLADNKEDRYDILINTSPLDLFIKSIKYVNGQLLKSVKGLKHNSVFIIGLGIEKPPAINKSWIYFPDSRFPFFRVTYLSNYSPQNTPDPKKYYSLLCETSYSEFKKESTKTLLERTISGLIDSGILQNSDRKHIVSKFLFDIKYAYPLPTLKRDKILKNILPALEEKSIYSRGRFGAWKYETGNMDHCVIQGKEIVDRVILGSKESLWSLDK